MELEKFARQLRLMVMLTQNRVVTVEEISETLGMSKRSIYRYIELFKSMGFIVIKQGSCYRIDHTSPFFENLGDKIHFSESEALTISRVLNSVYDNSVEVRHLREKMAYLYDSDILARHGVDSSLAQNISRIFQAIREQRVVLFRNYKSASSGKVSNRIVEPYMFINQNNEVRCFELTSKTNKTFKITRIEAIEQLDLLWSHTSEHAPFYSDLFGFTGEERQKVSLVLDQLATSILLEEYPDSQRQLKQLPDGRQRLDTEVCSFIGIGRFVLGLFEHIEIVDSPDFAEHMKQRVAKLVAR